MVEDFSNKMGSTLSIRGIWPSIPCLWLLEGYVLYTLWGQRWPSWGWQSNPGLEALDLMLIGIAYPVSLELLTKALHYNFSFGISLSKQLRNLTKVNVSSLTKIITSFTCYSRLTSITKIVNKNIHQPSRLSEND